MNAARQLIARRMALTTGPRLTTPMVRYASTAAAHSSKSMAPKDRQLMHGVFTAATAATIGGVTYAATRSGSRVNNRFSKKNSNLDSSKWFLEGTDVDKFLANQSK
ncbi:hypothetical protein ABEF95_000612 [Exophiala dermatitidis]